MVLGDVLLDLFGGLGTQSGFAGQTFPGPFKPELFGIGGLGFPKSFDRFFFFFKRP